MKPVIVALLLSAPLATGCGSDDSGTSPPGLDEPSCTMTWQAYRIDLVTVPRSAAEATLFGLDLDEYTNDSNDGIDNHLGVTLGTLLGLSGSWDVNAAIAAHLAAGRLHWVLQVGTCFDGDEVRTRLGRGVDVDADGAFELAAAGIAAVGTRGARLVTAHGTARVPFGFLFDGRGDLATDAWQVGFALTTDLRVEADGGLGGKLGFGVGQLSDAALEPMRAYATTAFNDGAAGEFWQDADIDRDGTISTAELRGVVDRVAPPDLDLGERIEDDAGYRIGDLDGTNDHLSLGIAIHATPVAIE